jgi:peptidoglycan/LPS O-acetylase OafA/YrhL
MLDMRSAAPVEPLASPAAPAAPGTPAGSRVAERLGHRPALDGLRAVAVISVLLYHGGVRWMSGGFLGVDLFFVLSGFLITTLLVEEWRRGDGISIRAFYGRRLRRLTPALVIVLAAVVAYAALLAQDGELAALRGDLLATLGYVANWRLVLADRGYFDAFAVPSPLSHTWSLAVEEQWYLVWPVLAALLLGRSGGRAGRLRTALAVTVGLAAASALWAAILHHPGDDPSRVYYGTDTRAQQLLLGAALALGCAVAGRLTVQRGWARALSAAGLLAAGWWVWACTRVTDQSPWLFEGGQALVALVVAVIILAAVQPRGVLRGVLALEPLRQVGRISYGLYLWHIPVFVALTSRRAHLDGTALLLARLALTVAAAALSHRLVEEPIRSRRALRRPGLVAVPALGLLAVAALVVTRPPEPAGAPVLSEQVGPATEPGRADAAEATPGVAGGELRSATSGGAAAAAVPYDAAGSEVVWLGDVEQYADYDSGRIPPPSPVAGMLRVAIHGDSVALNLSLGHVQGSGTPPVLVWDQSALGCSLFPGERMAGDHAIGEHPLCASWRDRRPTWVGEWRPDVVMVLSGVWDVYDVSVGGERLAFGSPAFDAWYGAEMDALIGELSRDGAVVAVLTAPCNQRAELLTIPDPPENDEGRIAHLNGLLAAAVDRHPRQASLIDLHGLVCPGGEFRARLGEVQIRHEDGVHFTAEGATLLRGLVFPQLAELADRRSTSP